MPRYKPSDCHALMLRFVLCEQIALGSSIVGAAARVSVKGWSH